MATRVDFYVTEGTQPNACLLTACRITEKAWKSGHSVFVLASTLADARRVDEMMWTYKQDSFVPHMVIPYGPDGGLPGDIEANQDLGHTPVWLGAGAIPVQASDVLINLTEDVPLAYTQFARVAELIDGSPVSRESGRKRFRYYKEQSCDLHTHNL